SAPSFFFVFRRKYMTTVSTKLAPLCKRLVSTTSGFQRTPMSGADTTKDENGDVVIWMNHG
ncbi:MAG TPA: hypothetical protein VF318_03930, partial [Dehalococcoidales bacterium]